MPFVAPNSGGGTRASFPGGAREDEVLAALRDELPILPPWGRFHYSNLGFALLGRALGHALEPAGGKASAGAYERAVEARLLRPLGMANATFSNADALASGMVAVGTHASGEEVNVSASCAPSDSGVAWGAPCGCLWASADDLGAFMKLWFRDEAPADGREQPLDGDTLREMLSAQTLLRDGDAIGAPWEMTHRGAADASQPRRWWYRSKQGELDGYRSSVALVPELQLGVFVAALVTDVDEPTNTVWTYPLLDALAPVVEAALWRLAAERAAGEPPLPPALRQRYEGTYAGGIGVATGGARNATLLMTVPGGPTRNLTAAGGASPSGAHAFVAHRDGGTGAPAADCRHLDDGDDGEIFYFEVGKGGAPAVALRFMGVRYERQHGGNEEERTAEWRPSPHTVPARRGTVRNTISI